MPGVPINDGNQVRAPRYLDLRQGQIVGGRSVPYDNAADALTAVLDTRKAVGFPFYVKNGNVVETWRFAKDESDAWIVVKDASGDGGSQQVEHITTSADPESYTVAAGYLLEKVIVKPASDDDLGISSPGNTGSGDILYPEAVTAAGGAVWLLNVIAFTPKTILFEGFPVGSDIYIIKAKIV